MKETKINRRMAENEVVFRKYNEQLEAGLKNLRRIAKEDNQEDLLHEQSSEPLHFYCECSDEACRHRVKVAPERYTAIHVERDCFVVAPGHDTPEIEDVVTKETEYWVVRKHETPPEDADTLHVTPANNA